LFHCGGKEGNDSNVLKTEQALLIPERRRRHKTEVIFWIEMSVNNMALILALVGALAVCTTAAEATGQWALIQTSSETVSFDPQYAGSPSYTDHQEVLRHIAAVHNSIRTRSRQERALDDMSPFSSSATHVARVDAHDIQ
jgi:hypothetical protein